MGTPTTSAPTPGPIGTGTATLVTDAPEPSAFIILAAIFVLGFALLALATWYTARKTRR